LSHKINLVGPVNPTLDTNMLVQHSEATFEIKRYLIEKAKLQWKELREVNVNAVLAHAAQKQKVLD